MPKMNIPFGQPKEEMGMPEQEAPETQENPNRDLEIQAGLQQILASENIDEIKSIAQKLLGEQSQDVNEGAPEASKSEAFGQGLDKILGK